MPWNSLLQNEIILLHCKQTINQKSTASVKICDGGQEKEGEKVWKVKWKI